MENIGGRIRASSKENISGCSPGEKKDGSEETSYMMFLFLLSQIRFIPALAFTERCCYHFSWWLGCA